MFTILLESPNYLIKRGEYEQARQLFAEIVEWNSEGGEPEPFKFTDGEFQMFTDGKSCKVEVKLGKKKKKFGY
jgi:hypothetical protein